MATATVTAPPSHSHSHITHHASSLSPPTSTSTSAHSQRSRGNGYGNGHEHAHAHAPSPTHGLSPSAQDVPPFVGYVETTLNALRLIHAARQGVIPRITRRLNESERKTMIKSGAVFVFSVDESGIKRWTDGLLWSPSRIVGNFLVYRELNERANSRGHQRRQTEETRAMSSPSRSLALSSSTGLANGEQGTFKPGGLIKKTITVTIEGTDLHLISYYTMEDLRAGRLQRPSAREDIMSLPMPPHLFRLTSFRVPPKIELGPDGHPKLANEAEDLDPPPPPPPTGVGGLPDYSAALEDAVYSSDNSSPSSSTDPISPVDGNFYHSQAHGHTGHHHHHTSSDHHHHHHYSSSSAQSQSYGGGHHGGASHALSRQLEYAVQPSHQHQQQQQHPYREQQYRQHIPQGHQLVHTRSFDAADPRMSNWSLDAYRVGSPSAASSRQQDLMVPTYHQYPSPPHQHQHLLSHTNAGPSMGSAVKRELVSVSPDSLTGPGSWPPASLHSARDWQAGQHQGQGHVQHHQHQHYPHASGMMRMRSSSLNSPAPLAPVYHPSQSQSQSQSQHHSDARITSPPLTATPTPISASNTPASAAAIALAKPSAELASPLVAYANHTRLSRRQPPPYAISDPAGRHGHARVSSAAGTSAGASAEYEPSVGSVMSTSSSPVGGAKTVNGVGSSSVNPSPEWADLQLPSDFGGAAPAYDFGARE